MPFKKKNKYFYFGLTLFSVVVASIILYVIFTNFSGFFAAISGLVKILSPFLYGIIFAYLMNPIMMWVQEIMLKFLTERDISPRRRERVSRVVGVIVSLIVLCFVIYLIIYMIVPQLVESLSTLFAAETVVGYYNQLRGWIFRLFQDNPGMEEWFINRLDDIYKIVDNWLADFDLQALVVGVTSGVYSVVREILNIIIGFVAAIYMLLSKNKFQAQLKKIAVALFSEKHCDHIFEVCRRTNRIFGSFIVGKIIDSLIIGILCYFGMLILRLPYPMLIATIIGVTNIIPFFGPIFGLVPSAILILLTSPIQCLYFLIFGLALQQFDGNFLGPRILGDSVGISSFWILFSITVAGGLFGFAGMVLGVPFFAVFYSLFSDFVNNRLRKKDEPTQTECYREIGSVADLHQPQQAQPATEPPDDLLQVEEIVDPEEEIEFEPDPDPDSEQTDQTGLKL